MTFVPRPSSRASSATSDARALDLDPQIARRAMPDGVRRHLLHRLQQDARHFRLQPRKRHGARHVQPRARQVLGKLRELAFEIDGAIFLRFLHQGANLAERGAGEILRGADRRSARFRARMRRGLEIETERGEVMPERVMQVLRDAQALVEAAWRALLRPARA